MEGQNWDKIFTNAETREAEEELRRKFEDMPAPEMYDINSLEKSEFEKQAETEALEALNIFLTEIGLPAAKINTENIHIVSSEDYKEKIQDDPSERGKTIFRQVYIQRNPNEVSFLSDLTHEVAHAASATSVQIEQTVNKNETTRNITLKRSGLSFRPDKSKDTINFEGINEAVTEMISLIIRNIMARTTKLIDGPEKKELKTRAAYGHLISLLEKLVDLVAETPDKIMETQTELCRNYITGTYSFFQKLEKIKPGANKLLLEMGKEKKDALRVAKKLGLEKTTQKK